jgi:hypothetical protein
VPGGERNQIKAETANVADAASGLERVDLRPSYFVVHEL